MSLHQVSDHGVLNIRKLGSPEGKERRFRQVVENTILLKQVDRIVLVVPSEVADKDPIVETQRLVVEELSRTHRLEVVEYGPDRVREGFLKDTAQLPSNRRLGQELARLFPELGRVAPRRPMDQSPQIRTPKERYWSRMFLALGAGLLLLRSRLLDNQPTL